MSNFIDYKKVVKSEIKKKNSQRMQSQAKEGEKDVKLPNIGPGDCTFITEPGLAVAKNKNSN